MSGDARPKARNTVTEEVHRGGKSPGIATAALAEIALAVAVAITQTTLPAGLESPDSGVVCNRQRAICYDRYGASFSLTEAFLGHIAAGRITASLRSSGIDNRPGTTFSTAEGVECVRGTGPCRLQQEPNAALTAVLYAPPSRPNGQTEEMSAVCVERLAGSARKRAPAAVSSCQRPGGVDMVWAASRIMVNSADIARKISARARVACTCAFATSRPDMVPAP